MIGTGEGDIKAEEDIVTGVQETDGGIEEDEELEVCGMFITMSSKVVKGI